MAKVEINVFVVRIDGEVVRATGIEDGYNSVQIHIEKKFLTEDDIRKYFNYMSKDYIERKVKEFNENPDFKLIDEQEAKDITCKLSRVTLSIEEVTVNL